MSGPEGPILSGDQGESGHDNGLGTDPTSGDGRDRCDQEQRERDGRDADPGFEGAVPEDELQVLGHEEDTPEQREEDEAEGGDSGAVPPVPEEAKRQHGVVDTPFPDDEDA